MASGFIVLTNGRCFSRTWGAHDIVLRTVAEHLTNEPLRQWILEKLPGPNDEQHIGYGPWFRQADQAIMPRFIDLRLMTVENQLLFCAAVKLAASLRHDEEWLNNSLQKFADMVERMERGEPPLEMSDWISIMQPEADSMEPSWVD